MKPQSHQNPVPYRRYPSLSDDGQPYFPEGWWRAWFSRRFLVRGLALAALTVILVALFANRTT